MLDINLIRENPERVRQSLLQRQMDAAPIEKLLQLDTQRRELIQQTETLKAERNMASKEIAQLKDRGERPGRIEAMPHVGEHISQLDVSLLEVEEQLNNLLAGLPN